VQPDRYVYPPYDAPLLDAWDHRFEAAYAILHPCIRMPESLSWQATRRYPSAEEILVHGAKVGWMQVAGETGLGNCARINQALLTCTGAVTEHLSDPAAAAKLAHYFQSCSNWMPGCGDFEPLLYADFLSAFTAAGHADLIFVPEFPQLDPVQTLSVAALQDHPETFPARGTMLAPDESFLFTVDWDSYFTLFYGSQEFVAGIARDRSLEGFLAQPATEHFWFNYSMGCATVTLSPEQWSTV